MNDLNNPSRSAQAIKVKNVTFRYSKSLTVLNKCSVYIKEGEIFALLGPNGCGKTTILKLILGRAQPEMGWVRVFGQRPGSKHCNIPGSGAGYMPQEIALFPEFTIEENLLYFAKIFHLKSEEFKERLKHLTQLLSLNDSKLNITKLSGGQQRLVSLAVAIIHRPRLIILDEPTVGVDPILRTRIWCYLKDMCAKNGNTILITTHYIEEARRASTVAFMKSGAILNQSNPQNLLNEYQCTTLEEVFLRLWRQRERKPIVNDLNSELNFDEEQKGNPIHTNKCLDFPRVLAILWRFNLRVKKFPILVLSFVLIPFLSLFSLYLSTGHLPHDIPVGIYSEESLLSKEGPLLSKQFIDLIDGDFLDVMQYETKESAVDSLIEGKNSFVIFFAQNFSTEFQSRLLRPFERGVEEEDSSLIRLQIDSSRVVMLTFGLQYLAEKVQQFIANVSQSLGLNARALTLPVSVEQPIYGTHPFTGEPSEKFRVNYDYLAPGFLLVGIHMSSVVFSAFVIINNRRDSQMNRYFISGGQPMEVLFAHYLSIINYIVIQILLLLMSASFLFDIRQVGSYVEVYLVCFLQSLQGLSIGLLIALIFKEELSIGVSLCLLLFPMYFASGVFWPLEGIPSYFRGVADWTPLSKPIEALRCIMLRGWDHSHPMVFMGYVVSGSYTLVISIISILFFRKHQEPIF